MRQNVASLLYTYEGMKVAIGCDHAGFEAKEIVSNWLKENEFDVVDKGTYSLDSVDYPDFAHAVAHAVSARDAELGILICGSANGVAITANKHQAIRAAICWSPEIAELARQHNDANVCCLPARFVNDEELIAIVKRFFAASFEGGRHATRVNKIACA